MNKKILGVRFDDFRSESEFLNRVLKEFQVAKLTNQSKLIAHLNVHCLNIAYTDENYLKLLNKADVLFLDSIGLKLAANLFLKLRIAFASTPPVWMHEFFKMVPSGTRIYFVGDDPDVVKNYNGLFLKLFPLLNAVGYHHGFFLKDAAVEAELFADIRKNKPDIILVGMGMPIQEFWIEQMKNKLQVAMFIPVGAYFQRMTGKQKRPWSMISKLGLEWLYRLFTNPKKLFRRYTIGNFLFLYRIMKYRNKLWAAKKLLRKIKTSKVLITDGESKETVAHGGRM